MPDSLDLSRKLIIKTNVVKRYGLAGGIRLDSSCSYAKEVASYERECGVQRARIERMTGGVSGGEDGVCPHERAKQIEVQEENSRMVVECRGKHAAALEDLREFLSRHPTDTFDNVLLTDAQSLVSAL